MKILTKILGGIVRKSVLTEDAEREIIWEMKKIKGINDFWELHKQAGYQLYGKTDDKRYLGYVEMANTMLKLMDSLKKEQEDEERRQGYESTV